MDAFERDGQALLEIWPVADFAAEQHEEMRLFGPEVLIQAVELFESAAVVVAQNGRADTAHGRTAQLALELTGQKKRTSSGSVRRWPNLRTRSSSERPDRRSDDRNLVSFIRDGQALAALGTPASQHLAAILGGHPLAEAVAIRPAPARWLVSSLHGWGYPSICSKSLAIVGEPEK